MYPIQGGIAAANPTLSRWMLDTQDIIEMAMLELQGYAVYFTENGMVKEKIVSDDDPNYRYSKKCLLFVRGKLNEIMGKHAFLSNFKNEDEMYRTAQEMSLNFIVELNVSAKEFEITPEQLIRLVGKHNNYLDYAIRRALNKGEKDFLQKTISETVQNIKQDVRESQEKGGGLFGLFGGKK